MAILENSKTSPSQISKFFENAFNQVCDKSVDEEVKVSVVSTEDVIDQIYSSNEITHLEIKVSYTNNDNNEGWDYLIDQQMKDCKVSEMSTKVVGTQKKPIQLKKDTFLGGMLNLSRENGYASATLITDGKRKKVVTKEHPLISSVCFDDSDEYSLLLRLKGLIINLAHR